MTVSFRSVTKLIARTSFVLIAGLFAVLFFYALINPLGYLNTVAGKVPFYSSHKHVIRLVDYYFEKGIFYNCHTIKYIGYKAWGPMIPLRDDTGQSRLTGNIDNNKVIYLWGTDFVTENVKEYYLAMADHNNLVRSRCGHIGKR
ncbi:hypothetical protein [Kordiimonas sp. SCSIO 12610]|uniref:hypothetical protein n=1 Tax=Kordiimonas sp. SCSIO 12610 TaxID=2829597 RepID=UPI002108901F|nr:hypothetical protein [Kordiimonas sp. SCSIO 12610]UTW56219.1 hypothetical protein KFF44_04785 [Kordiimonas sp. SCSIO 12610]